MWYIFIYSDGSSVGKYFKTFQDARWFALNEGDNLIDWGEL